MRRRARASRNASSVSMEGPPLRLASRALTQIEQYLLHLRRIARERGQIVRRRASRCGCRCG